MRHRRRAIKGSPAAPTVAITLGPVPKKLEGMPVWVASGSACTVDVAWIVKTGITHILHAGHSKPRGRSVVRDRNEVVADAPPHWMRLDTADDQADDEAQGLLDDVLDFLEDSVRSGEVRPCRYLVAGPPRAVVLVTAIFLLRAWTMSTAQAQRVLQSIAPSATFRGSTMHLAGHGHPPKATNVSQQAKR